MGPISRNFEHRKHEEYCLVDSRLWESVHRFWVHSFANIAMRKKEKEKEITITILIRYICCVFTFELHTVFVYCVRGCVLAFSRNRLGKGDKPKSSRLFVKKIAVPIQALLFLQLEKLKHFYDFLINHLKEKKI